jgi:competence protein ComEC
VALAGVAQILPTPLAIADVGFWFTFGATAAILLGVPRLTGSASSWRRVCSGVLAASCAVELALGPIAAAVFQRVTLAGLLLNFAALPAMTVVQLAAMAVVAFDAAMLPRAAAGAAELVRWGSLALTESARVLDYAPWLTWRVPSPPGTVLAVYYVSLGVVAAPRPPRAGASEIRRIAASAAACCLIVMASAPQVRLRPAGDGRLRLVMLDVGQGDAMLVTFPNGRHLLVDSGPSGTGGFDAGDRVVGPALRARGVFRLDYLAVTHGDPDHIGGARSIVRDFAPREVWWGVPVPPHAPTAELRVEAGRVRAAWRTLQRGDRVEIGGVEVRVHHPPPPEWERQRVRNDDSVVLEVRMGQVSMVLTGDIGRDVEQELVGAIDAGPAVVLKVAHHGSATSSSMPFVAALRPDIALIGVGRGNPYGHPVPAVLDRLRRAGAEVFRTDRDGQIEVATDGTGIAVDTWTGRSFVR